MYPMSTWGTILMQEAADSHREKTNLELIDWLNWLNWSIAWLMIEFFVMLSSTLHNILQLI